MLFDVAIFHTATSKFSRRWASLLAEAPFPLYSLSWRAGEKETFALGRNSLGFNRRGRQFPKRMLPVLFADGDLSPLYFAHSFTVIPLSFSEPA